ncbi:MAG: PEP-CTERM sorting domain-containing protein [Prosthecobacter sp.]
MNHEFMGSICLVPERIVLLSLTNIESFVLRLGFDQSPRFEKTTATSSMNASPLPFRHVLVSCVMILVMVGALSVHAAVISVDFTGEFPPPVLAPTDVAGVVPAANWNSFAGRSGSPSGVLLDQSGAATTATLSYFANNDVKLTLPGSPTTTEKLFAGYNDSATNGSVGFTVSNIPYAVYDLYVYVTADNPNRRGFVTTSEAGTPDYYYSTASGLPNSFIEITSTGVGYTVGGNYARFQGLTDSSQAVTLSGLSSWSGIAGFQIQESVPEPGRAALLAMAALLGITVRRRRGVV